MEGVQWFLLRLLLLSVELGGRKRVCEIKWTPPAYASSEPLPCRTTHIQCQPTYIFQNIESNRAIKWTQPAIRMRILLSYQLPLSSRIA